MKTGYLPLFKKKVSKRILFLTKIFFWSLHSRGIFQSVNVKIFRNNSQVLKKKLSTKSDNPNLHPKQEFVKITVNWNHCLRDNFQQNCQNGLNTDSSIEVNTDRSECDPSNNI